MNLWDGDYLNSSRRSRKYCSQNASSLNRLSNSISFISLGICYKCNDFRRYRQIFLRNNADNHYLNTSNTSVELNT